MPPAPFRYVAATKTRSASVAGAAAGSAIVGFVPQPVKYVAQRSWRKLVVPPAALSETSRLRVVASGVRVRARARRVGGRGRWRFAARFHARRRDRSGQQALRTHGAVAGAAVKKVIWP